MAFVPRTPYASEYENTHYGEKTSDYGHWEREATGMRHGHNHTTARTYKMNWVEDNRQMAAPSESAPSEPAQQETSAPVEQEETTADHKGAEADYSQSFEPTTAAESYQSAFDRAVTAGKDITADEYLNQRPENKQGNGNRFTEFLDEGNAPASEELGPPALLEPSNQNDRYEGDIDSI